MICFCGLCSTLSGIGAAWCMARATNCQLTERFDEVNKRIDGQDETLKSIQSSLVELTLAVKALVVKQDKKEVKGYESDASLIIDGEESDQQLKDAGEEGESSSAIKGENEYIRQLSQKEYEEKRMKNQCLYCRQKYTQGHRCSESKLFMLICPEAKDCEIDNGDHSTTISKQSDEVTLLPDLNIQLHEESSVPLVNLKLDESFGSASSDQKNDPSLGGEKTSEKMSKPDSNPHVHEESPLPPVNKASADRELLKPIPDSSERADNVSKEPKLVSTFDSNSKDLNHKHPIPSKSEQGMESHDGISRKQVWDNGGKPEDTNHTFSSITSYDICPKKANTGAVKLKPSLHVKNREKRLQSKRAAEGPMINILRPGMVVLKYYISYDDQVKIVKTCRELGMSEGGFYQPVYNNGARRHYKMMCLGMNWDPESRLYTHTRAFDNSKPPKIPDYFHEMVKRAIQNSNAHIQKNGGIIIPSMSPDVCIAKFYLQGGKLGLHRDKDESPGSLARGLPVVSFSIGESAEFLYGNERDVEKAERVKLESGDVLIFGGESRHIFHGVSSIVADTAPKMLLEATNMHPGRLNLTFRQY